MARSSTSPAPNTGLDVFFAALHDTELPVTPGEKGGEEGWETCIAHSTHGLVKRGWEDNGTMRGQEDGNMGGWQDRNMGTQEDGNTGGWEDGNMGTWEHRRMGGWKHGRTETQEDRSMGHGTQDTGNGTIRGKGISQ
ncbi:hypothetical protein DFH29DRAFT_879565 [Suillus ampliporus]|nr:hypothetical protein DFH29DRAFT_879565 [Suillus ampliporus]